MKQNKYDTKYVGFILREKEERRQLEDAYKGAAKRNRQGEGGEMNYPEIDNYTKHIADLHREIRELQVKASALQMAAIAGWLLAITVWVLR